MTSKSWQTFQKLGLSKCFPLFDIMTHGTLNSQMMFFHTKFVILAAVIVITGSVSTHFVK